MSGTAVLLPADEVGKRHRNPAGEAPSPSCILPPPCQPPLPQLRRVLHPDGVQFAHPAEREFARLLAFYRVRWVYEPTTFALRWGDDGRPIECFAPDFFLPDHRLYVELTTMRQPLVTRKNRKLRRLLELYQGTRVRLLYRRDVLRLEQAYRQTVVAPRGLLEVLWPGAEIAARLRTLAEQVADEWLGRPDQAGSPVLLAVGTGATRFQAALAGALGDLGIRVDLDRLDPSRYRPTATGCVRALRGPAAPVIGRRVLLLGDVVSSGLSLGWAIGKTSRLGAADVRACALFDRRPARLLDTALSWVGFDAPDAPLAGFGLARHRCLRGLDDVGTVNSEP